MGRLNIRVRGLQGNADATQVILDIFCWPMDHGAAGLPTRPRNFSRLGSSQNCGLLLVLGYSTAPNIRVSEMGP